MTVITVIFIDWLYSLALCCVLHVKVIPTQSCNCLHFTTEDGVTLDTKGLPEAANAGLSHTQVCLLLKASGNHCIVHEIYMGLVMGASLVAQLVKNLPIMQET